MDKVQKYNSFNFIQKAGHKPLRTDLKGLFFPRHSVLPKPSDHAVSYWVPGENRPEPDADNSLPTSAETKNARSFISVPLHPFTVWCLSTGTNQQI
jgi:hypothetical protein